MIKPELARGLSELAEIYGVPERYGTVERAIDVFWGVLQDVKATAFAAAVQAYKRSDASYFPKPGQLRTKAMEQADWREGGQTRGPATYAEWERTWGQREVKDDEGEVVAAYSGCPICGAVPAMSASVPGGVPRWRVVHDGARHKAAGVPAIGTTDEIDEFYRPTLEAFAAEAALRERLRHPPVPPAPLESPPVGRTVDEMRRQLVTT